jgi:CBS domain containing-hemolysin-like protein
MLTAGVAIARIFGSADFAWMIGAAILVWLLFTLGQLVGRIWVQSNPVRWTLRLLPFVRFCMAILWPATALLDQASHRVEASVDADEDSILLSEDGVRLVLPGASDETEIEETEKEMITSILEMDETVAREVMVPRTDMVAVEAETRVAEVVDVILEAGHSRIPVYEQSIDQIIGLLYAKDLLRAFQDNRDDQPIRDLLRPAYFVPLTKNVKHLLAEMRKHRVHMAVVVDEYGGTAGLVTIEDILEEIVGEIQDEYDSAEESHVERLGKDSYLIHARMDNYTLAKLLDIDIDDEDADTVGGLVLGLLGHVPEPGESVVVENWRVTVLKVDARRIEQVRADRVDGGGDGEATEGGAQRQSARSPANSVKLSPSDS